MCAGADARRLLGLRTGPSKEASRVVCASLCAAEMNDVSRHSHCKTTTPTGLARRAVARLGLWGRVGRGGPLLPTGGATCCEMGSQTRRGRQMHPHPSALCFRKGEFGSGVCRSGPGLRAEVKGLRLRGRRALDVHRGGKCRNAMPVDMCASSPAHREAHPIGLALNGCWARTSSSSCRADLTLGGRTRALVARGGDWTMHREDQRGHSYGQRM